MALEDIENNKEKINEAALSVIKKGADDKILIKDEVKTSFPKNETKDLDKLTEEVEVKDEVKTDDGKFTIDMSGALTNVGENVSAFANEIGSNFRAIAEAVPKKIEEISQDPVKSKNFIRGLEIINASSGIKPIGQAKSPLGSISEGLLKAEKGFIAKDLAEAKIEAAKLKALNTKRGVLEPAEAALLKNYSAYTEDYAKKKKEFESTFNIYGLLKKSSFDKKGFKDTVHVPKPGSACRFCPYSDNKALCAFGLEN